jgi:hypothetical protein
MVELGASLRTKPAEGTNAPALDAALRVIEVTTAAARHLRSGPLPPAIGVERLALMAAAAQLRLVARAMGIEGSKTSEPPPTHSQPRDDTIEVAGRERFVSPSERSLLVEEKVARMRAALAVLVVETLALVDEILQAPSELGRGADERVLPPK